MMELAAKDRSNIPINKLHLEYLDTLCGLWPLIRSYNTARDANKLEEMQQIIEQQKVIIEHARQVQQKLTAYRTSVMNMYVSDSAFREKEDALCKDDFIRWINYYVWTNDPRLAPLGLPPHIPMVLWEGQEEFLLFVNDCYKNKRSWIADKSRGVGLTWLVCCYYIHHWLYHPGFVGGLGSRKEEVVDRSGDPTTLFFKLRYILDNLPANMRPEEFNKNRRSYDNMFRIVNPDNGSSIIGEGGDNIGAGGRTSIYIIDEKALIEHQELVDQALSFTSDCRGDISTPRGMNHFGKKRWSGKLPVFTLWWYRDPMRNHDWITKKRPKHNEWYELQKESLDDVVLAQEVDIDYHASVEGVFIPSQWVQAAIDFNLEPSAETVAGFDVAGAGNNESVYVARSGPVVHEPVVFPYSSPVEAAWAAVNQGENDGISVLCYDEGGIGQSIPGLFSTSDRTIQFKYYGIYGEQAASDAWLKNENKRAHEKFANRRAELWWYLRERFRKTYEHRNNIKFYDNDEMISIPGRCSKLIQQLSAPLMKLRASGRILVESKLDMRRRGIDSPDHADALAYSFAAETITTIVKTFDYTTGGNQYTSFPLRHDNAATVHYVSLVQSADRTVSVLCCIWRPSASSPLLQVYDECHAINPQPQDIIDFVNTVMEPDRKPIKEWLANEEMFEDAADGKISPWYLYRKAGVRLHRNYRDATDGAVMLLNQMFDKKMIQIHTNCEQLFHQLREWTHKKGAAGKEPHGLIRALCQLLSRLKTKRELPDHRFDPEPYRRAGRFSRIAKGVYPDVQRAFEKHRSYYIAKARS